MPNGRQHDGRLIFALLGMELFGGKCDAASRWYFDYYGPAMLATLGIFTGGWQDVHDACTDGALAVAQRVLRARTPPCGAENMRRAVVFEGEGRAGHRAGYRA